MFFLLQKKVILKLEWMNFYDLRGGIKTVILWKNSERGAGESHQIQNQKK